MLPTKLYRSIISLPPYPTNYLKPSWSFWNWNASKRSIHMTSSRYQNKAYDPDGKTTVTILNDEKGAPLMIDSYNQRGFKLNNGMQVLGPMIIFPKTVLGWDVGEVNDITPESLALFSVLEPKPDVLVIGIGDKGAKLSVDTVIYLRKRKINIEVLATEYACTTFNFLSGEGRCCAGVMLPPNKIPWTAEDLANSKMRKNALYDVDPRYDEKTYAESPFEHRRDKITLTEQEFEKDPWQKPRK